MKQTICRYTEVVPVGFTHMSVNKNLAKVTIKVIHLALGTKTSTTSPKERGQSHAMAVDGQILVLHKPSVNTKHTLDTIPKLTHGLVVLMGGPIKSPISPIKAPIERVRISSASTSILMETNFQKGRYRSLKTVE